MTIDSADDSKISIFESDHQYESNLESDVRFEIKSNHEALQVPKYEDTFGLHLMLPVH